MCLHLRHLFKGIAQRDKCSMGWFFGFKLHLICNEKGELLNFMITPGDVDDRKPLEYKENDELKNIAQVEHSRHRCFDNFIVNMLGAIAAYCVFPKKPCINVQRTLDTQLTLFWIPRTHVIYYLSFFSAINRNFFNSSSVSI